jgi:hypothetical protein
MTHKYQSLPEKGTNMSAIRKSFGLIAMFLGLFVSSARAEGLVTVKVPFSFIVGHTEFPAGQYDIRSVEDIGAVMSIEGEGTNQRSHAFVFTMPAVGGDPAGNEPALVFVRHENTYKLTEIWESGTEGRALEGLSAADRTARAETQGESSIARVYVLAASTTK